MKHLTLADFVERHYHLLGIQLPSSKIAVVLLENGDADSYLNDLNSPWMEQAALTQRYSIDLPWWSGGVGDTTEAAKQQLEDRLATIPRALLADYVHLLVQTRNRRVAAVLGVRGPSPVSFLDTTEEDMTAAVTRFLTKKDTYVGA